MGRLTPESLDIGSVVPHPVLGYIWVTLEEEKRGISGNSDKHHLSFKITVYGRHSILLPRHGPGSEAPCHDRPPPGFCPMSSGLSGIGMGAVAHFAQAVYALVGLDSQDRVYALRTDCSDADVRNP